MKEAETAYYRAAADCREQLAAKRAWLPEARRRLAKAAKRLRKAGIEV